MTIHTRIKRTRAYVLAIGQSPTKAILTPNDFADVVSVPEFLSARGVGWLWGCEISECADIPYSVMISRANGESEEHLHDLV